MPSASQDDSGLLDIPEFSGTPELFDYQLMYGLRNPRGFGRLKPPAASALKGFAYIVRLSRLLGRSAVGTQPASAALRTWEHQQFPRLVPKSLPLAEVTRVVFVGPQQTSAAARVLDCLPELRDARRLAIEYDQRACEALRTDGWFHTLVNDDASKGDVWRSLKLEASPASVLVVLQFVHHTQPREVWKRILDLSLAHADMLLISGIEGPAIRPSYDPVADLPADGFVVEKVHSYSGPLVDALFQFEKLNMLRLFNRMLKAVGLYSLFYYAANLACLHELNEGPCGPGGIVCTVRRSRTKAE